MYSDRAVVISVVPIGSGVVAYCGTASAVVSISIGSISIANTIGITATSNTYCCCCYYYYYYRCCYYYCCYYYYCCR